MPAMLSDGGIKLAQIWGDDNAWVDALLIGLLRRAATHHAPAALFDDEQGCAACAWPFIYILILNIVSACDAIAA